MAAEFSAEEQKVLDRRAARRASAPAGLDERTQRHVTFRRGETRYALAAADLRGARALPKLTRLPNTPAHLLGVVNLAGHTLGALDIERFERPAAPAPAQPWALWLSRDTRSVVVVADELLDVVDLLESALATETRGAFTGRLAGLVLAVLPGPLLVLDTLLLLNPELYRTLDR